MTHSNRWLVLTSVLTIALGGCGSCQRTEEAEPGSGVQRGAPEPKAPTKPTPMTVPSVARPETGANDCFVFVDA
jgi:hypothetical protein